jgi:hypothetical protein
MSLNVSIRDALTKAVQNFTKPHNAILSPIEAMRARLSKAQNEALHLAGKLDKAFEEIDQKDFVEGLIDQFVRGANQPVNRTFTQGTKGNFATITQEHLSDEQYFIKKIDRVTGLTEALEAYIAFCNPFSALSETTQSDFVNDFNAYRKNAPAISVHISKMYETCPNFNPFSDSPKNLDDFVRSYALAKAFYDEKGQQISECFDFLVRTIIIEPKLRNTARDSIQIFWEQNSPGLQSLPGFPEIDRMVRMPFFEQFAGRHRRDIANPMTIGEYFQARAPIGAIFSTLMSDANQSGPTITDGSSHKGRQSLLPGIRRLLRAPTTS